MNTRLCLALPDLNLQPACHVLYGLTDNPCGRPAAWLIRTRCPKCDFREREFVCIQCLAEHEFHLAPLSCTRCYTEVGVLEIQPALRDAGFTTANIPVVIATAVLLSLIPNVLVTAVGMVGLVWWLAFGRSWVREGA